MSLVEQLLTGAAFHALTRPALTPAQLWALRGFFVAMARGG